MTCSYQIVLMLTPVCLYPTWVLSILSLTLEVLCPSLPYSSGCPALYHVLWIPRQIGSPIQEA